MLEFQICDSFNVRNDRNLAKKMKKSRKKKKKKKKTCILEFQISDRFNA